DEPFPRREIQFAEKLDRLSQRPRCYFRNGLAAHTHRQAFRLESRAMAGDAGPRHHESGKIFGKRAFPIVLTIEKLDESGNAFAALLAAVEDDLLRLWRQLIERKRKVDPGLLFDPLDLGFDLIVQPGVRRRKTALK